MAREKNTARSEARRRTRLSARESLIADEAIVDEEESADAVEAPARTRLFTLPDVREDVRQLPDMFRAKPLLWLPFLLLIGSFFIALGLPFTGLDPTLIQILFFAFQFFFLPQGLATFLVGGFLAPRASYLVGLLLGVLNAALLLIFAVIRSEEVLASAPPGTDPGEAQVGLALLVGYALVVGPIAAAFAAWYRGFLNRMGASGRNRRLVKEQEEAQKRRDEKRAAKRPANSKTGA